jgi:hypothetical protein
LFLDFKLLCQVLLVLPLYLRPDRAIVHEIARISNLLAVHICLLEHLVLEILVLRKLEDELESRLGLARREVLDAEVSEVLERRSITIVDQLGQTDVVS